MSNLHPLLTISESQMILGDIFAPQKPADEPWFIDWLEVYEKRKTKMADVNDPLTNTFLKLLDLGLDPNTIIDRTKKPILCEISHPNMTPSMLEALLEYGAKLDLYQKYELKPLVFCLEYRVFDFEWETKANLLARFGMEVDEPETEINKISLLQHMSSTGQKRWIEWLIEKGADPYHQDKWGIDSFSVAALGLESKIQKGSANLSEKPPTQEKVVEWILNKYSEVQQQKLQKSTPKALGVIPGKRL